MTSQEHIQEVLIRLKTIFEDTSALLQPVKVGERLTKTVLCEQIGAKYNMSKEQAYPILMLVLKNYPNFVEKMGTKGGMERVAEGE